MAAPTETELKLAVSEHDLPRLLRRLNRFGPGRRRQVDSLYFDTPDAVLAGAGMALRLRRDGRRWVQTLKIGAGSAPLARREEWEMPAPGGRLRLDAFGATGLARRLPAERAGDLAPRFRTRFERTVRNVEHAGAKIEIALDRGSIEAGARRAVVRELELELKSGPAMALLDLALLLCAKDRRSDALALLPFGESKAARGRRLAEGRPPVPVRADARRVFGPLGPDMPAAAALRGVVERGVTSLLDNLHGALEHDDMEFVHQGRVAVRRMRVAIRALGEASAFPMELDAQLRRVGRQLGGARDWDVLVGETLPAATEALPEWHEALEPVLAAAQGARRRAGRRALAALRGPRFTVLALRLLRWTADAPAGSDDLAALARNRLAEAREIVARDGARFHRAHAEGRHRTRVRVKRLRYLLELFGPALPGTGIEAERARCVSLQSALGRMNDARVARSRVRQLRGHRKARAALLRWLRAREREQRREIKALFDGL